MHNVINIGEHRKRCVLATHSVSTLQHTNTTPGDLAVSISMQKLLEELESEHSWMQGAVRVPANISTGSTELDAAGVALALNEAAQQAGETLEVFNLTLQLFNTLLGTLDEAQRQRVLITLGKDAARQLVMLDYAENLKTAELSDLVDKCLRTKV